MFWLSVNDEITGEDISKLKKKLWLVCPVLPVSMDCSFFIASSVFFDIYLQSQRILILARKEGRPLVRESLKVGDYCPMICTQGDWYKKMK